MIEITRTKDKFQCTKWIFYSSNTLLTSDNGQPLNKGQNGQKTMGPKHVRYSEVPLYLRELPTHFGDSSSKSACNSEDYIFVKIVISVSV